MSAILILVLVRQIGVLKLLEYQNDEFVVKLNIRKIRLCSIYEIVKSVKIKFLAKIMEKYISVEKPFLILFNLKYTIF